MKAATVQDWDSTLDSVVVHAQGALCRRLARGSVPPDGRVRIPGLPRTVDPGSLRARVVGTSGVRVVEARIEVDAEPAGAGAPRELDREVERLREECAAARARRDRQLGLIEEVRALRPIPPGREREDLPRRTPVHAWLELADFVEARLTGLHDRLARLEEALLRVEHDFMVAADALTRASTDAPSAHVATTVSALVTLHGTDDPGPEVEVEVEYGVPGAVWAPAYRLDHRQGDDSGRLVLRASVAQRTGEDWNGVRIALATADLHRRTDLPRLRSIRIGRRQPAPAPAGWREPPAGLSGLFTGYDASAARPAPAAARQASAAETVAGVVAGAAAGPRADRAAAGPVPMPPPAAPQAYGAPPPPFPAPGATGAPPGHAQPTRSRRGAPPRGGGASFETSVAGPPPAPGGPARATAPAGAVPAAPAPAAPPAGPPQPSGAELDYAALVLAGPGEPAGRRGLLFPDSSFDPVAAEHRRRAEAVAALPLPGHAVRPRESAGSFDHRFDATARTDIPSDGTWHTVTVTGIPVGLRTEYLCVPAVEETVYATLVLSNATGQALLAGPVEVTVDDEFLLTTALPTLAPGGGRRVGLGPAEAVRVTRRTELRESSAGLRGGTTVLDHRVHVELANRLARPVTVEVRERVPVTSDPDVRIDERADWTVPEEGAGPDRLAPGTRVWRVDLPAGGTAVLDGGYEIRIPAGKALVDGNRRS
ncbi:hypothetical protein QFZ75_000164 [Streptomyces sp. V3I8]|uniref:DUF4139 domain-containing protein n=1 Tax=Streptomyces sp. V3I8 TaxID=3042279 RepID=UPI0027815081|nr:DUF4139 domain-containing protein [Streptomyces sp. V3I8]MDQ1033748.1 hypothetical protein [Streptomyces sp. V3I8]